MGSLAKCGGWDLLGKLNKRGIRQSLKSMPTLTIRYTMLFLAFMFSIPLIAQTDRCDTATELMVYTDCRSAEGNTIGLTGFSTENSCNGITDDDGWYRFRAISTSTLIRVFSDKDVEIGLAIFTNCNTEIACIDGTEPGGNGNLLVNTTPGESYFIQVYDVREGGGSFLICVVSSGEEGNLQSDCDQAQVICKDDIILFDPLGPGKDDFASGNNHQGCLKSKENRSAWYYFEINRNAPPNLDLSFVITPEDDTDYDFAIFGPNVPCDALGSPVRCSWSAITCDFCPQTGLGFGANDAGEDAHGDGMVAPLIVQPGEGFFLLVDNYFNNTTGFALKWGGAAAPFLNCLAETPCGVFADAGGPFYVCEETQLQLNGLIQGANEDLEIQWEDQDGVASAFSQADTSHPILNLPPDFTEPLRYFLTVNQADCEHTDVLTIQKNCVDPDSLSCQEILSAHFDLNHPGCQLPNSGTILVGYIEGGTPPYRFQIAGNEYQSENTFSNLEAGTYPISIKDSKGCQLDTLLQLSDAPAIAFTLGPDLVIDQGDTLKITANSSLSTKQIQQIQWSHQGVNPCDEPPCLTATFAPTTSLEISATLRTLEGCEIRDALSISVNSRSNIYVPSAFSPNGDGINDTFTVFADVGISKITSIKILDRWGNLVFAQNDFDANVEHLGWDGNFRGRPSSPGLYIYLIQFESANQSLMTQSGEVVLIR